MGIGTGREAHPDRQSRNGSDDGSPGSAWLGSSGGDSTDGGLDGAAVVPRAKPPTESSPKIAGPSTEESRAATNGLPPPEWDGLPAQVVEWARQLAAAQVVEARAASIIAAADERDRIAAELHHAVIHRLFAAGLSLSSATACLATITASERSAVTANHIRDAIGILDGAIGEVRAAVYRMRDRDFAGRSDLARRLRDVVTDMTAALGFAPLVRIDDGLDALTDGVGDDLVGALREALANIVRHARARSAVIAVSVEGSRLVLDVSDDGVGRGAGAPHRGLADLQERAEYRGGTLHVGAHDASCRTRMAGARVTWSVPT